MLAVVGNVCGQTYTIDTAWTKIDSLIGNVYTIASQNDSVYVGTSQGLYVSYNKWGQKLSTRVNCSLIKNEYEYFGDNKGCMYTFYKGNLNSTDTLDKDIAVRCEINFNNTIYVGTFGNGIWYLNLNVWTKLPQSDSLFVLSLAKNGDTLFAGTTKGVFKFINGIKITISSKGLLDQNVDCIAIYNDTIYAGTYKGLFKGINNTWISICPTFQKTVSSIILYKNLILIGTGGGNETGGKGIFKNSDSTWYLDTVGLYRDTNIYSLTIDTIQNIIYAGGKTGIYKKNIKIASSTVVFKSLLNTNTSYLSIFVKNRNIQYSVNSGYYEISLYNVSGKIIKKIGGFANTDTILNLNFPFNNSYIVVLKQNGNKIIKMIPIIK
jgi:hypothetical protein